MKNQNYFCVFSLIVIDYCKTSKNSCLQICNKIVGGVKCSCYSGYILDKNGFLCVKDPSVNISCTALNCEQICTKDSNNNPVCKCIKGFSLNSDNQTCTGKYSWIYIK